MTLVGVVSGIILALLLRWFGPYSATVAIGAMAVGYASLASATSLLGVLIAMLCIGFSSGVLMPLLLLKAVRITPEASRAFAMAVVSVGVYFGQFISPVVLKWAALFSGPGDIFRAQFNFLAFSLGIATLVGLGVAFKNRKQFNPEAIKSFKPH
jgi:MFS family permease